MHMALSIIKTSIKNQPGMSLVEVILAAAIFAVISTGVISAIIYGSESTAVAGARERATKIAEEGIEAVRNIRDSGYSNLPADGTYGLTIAGGIWTFSGTSDMTDIFTRSITLSTIDSRTRNITVNVAWTQTVQRSGNLSLNTYLTDWVTPSITFRKGMLVYGDGGIISDAIKYQIYDDSTGTWSAAAATADVDTGSNNKYLRAARVFASPTRNEKILVSRHYNGTGQWIYAQVYNGTTNTWNTPVQLSTWNSSSYLNVQNFDATYTANGNLTVVYSDNSTTPKSRIWNGTSWSSQSSLDNLGSSQIPTYLITKSRPATNEIMLTAFTQASDTITEYYSGTTWLSHISHSTSAPLATKRLIDFDWSPQDISKGLLVYSTSSSARAITSKIWTADGVGDGSWSSSGTSATQGNSATRLSALNVVGIKGLNEFQTCSENTFPQIICYKTNFTPAFSNPTNQIIAPTTDTGIQKSFDTASELSGANVISVYSDASATAKLKQYNTLTSAWDVLPTNLNSLAVGSIKTARVESSPVNDDAMLFVSDNNTDLFSIAWNGTANALYTAPAGKAWTAHGTSGSNIADYWYDFTWDGV